PNCLRRSADHRTASASPIRLRSSRARAVFSGTRSLAMTDCASDRSEVSRALSPRAGGEGGRSLPPWLCPPEPEARGEGPCRRSEAEAGGRGQSFPPTKPHAREVDLRVRHCPLPVGFAAGSLPPSLCSGGQSPCIQG